MPYSPTISQVAKKRGTSLSLLLVEDDDNHAELIQSAIRSSPQLLVEISRSASFRETESILKSQPFDLVVLDLGLPESDGLDTLERFMSKKLPLPVIVLTSLANVEIGEKALQLGAMDFLGKDEISERSFTRSIRYSLERWKQKVALDSSLSDLERFGQAAAHDLVSPLNAIQGFARLIEIALENVDVSQDVRECLNLLEASSLRAANLVNDLHKFAQLGRQSLVKETINLNELLDEVESSMQLEVAEVEGSLVIYDLPSVQADRGLMFHVFQNLISNALKYRRHDVQPTVAVDYQEVDGHKVITVRDNGIGIEEEDCLRIFEAFERSSRTKRSDGSGLGLSICKRVIEAHDGTIWVDSLPNRGSAFSFYLAD